MQLTKKELLERYSMINTCVLQLERQFQLASIFLTIHLEVTFLKITDFLIIPDIPKREMEKSFTFLPKAIFLEIYTNLLHDFCNLSKYVNVITASKKTLHSSIYFELLFEKVSKLD